MSKHTVYQRHRISATGQRQIEGFQRNAMSQMYRAQLRREAQALGYRDHAIRLTDKQAISAIRHESQTIAGGIRRGYNDRLQAVLKALPEDASDAACENALRTELQRIHVYNHRFLVPRIADRARQMGTLDFHTRNSIQALFQVEPGDTAGLDDGCDEAISLGQVDPSTAASYLMPLHPRCPHGWVRQSVNAGSLPAADDLWVGEAA